LPRNPNLRIHLELEEKWRFTLYKDSQQHCSVRSYSSPGEAVEEAMVLNSSLNFAADREKRKANRPVHDMN
jgi:hypothetical protein